MGKQLDVELQECFQFVAAHWRTHRSLSSIGIAEPVQQMYRAQRADVEMFLSRYIRNPGGVSAEVVADWWEWALEEGGGFDSYDPSWPFYVWARFVLRCKCLAFLKRTFGTGRRMVILDFEPSDDVCEPVMADEHTERRAIVREAVDRLNPRMKMAVISRYWDNESSKEAARKYNVKAQDLDRWRFQARAILRNRLHKYFQSRHYDASQTG